MATTINSTQIGNSQVPPSQSEGCFSGTLPAAVNAYTYFPVYRAVTVGFNLVPPLGGTIKFQGSWDGAHWVDCTFRQMGAHGYSTMTSETENWVGSVATFDYLRFLTIVGGSADGAVYGRFSPHMSVLEGIEHGHEPHKIGSAAVSKLISVTDSNPDHVIWTPVTGHKICVTDAHFTVSEKTAIVYLHEGPFSDAKWIFKGKFKPTATESVYIPIVFALPHVFSTASVPLMVSQSDGAEIDGVIHGYETEG